MLRINSEIVILFICIGMSMPASNGSADENRHTGASPDLWLPGSNARNAFAAGRRTRWSVIPATAVFGKSNVPAARGDGGLLAWNRTRWGARSSATASVRVFRRRSWMSRGLRRGRHQCIQTRRWMLRRCQRHRVGIDERSGARRSKRSCFQAFDALSYFSISVRVAA